jgi:Tfp pilus assembly protein PilV
MIGRRKGTLHVPRRAFTMVEVTVTALMLAIAMTLTLKLLGWVIAERRALDRRTVAIQEVANQMERVSAIPWNDLDSNAVAKSTLSPSARDSLPGAELALDVDAKSSADAKRITIALRWRTRAGNWDAPVRLSAWQFQRKESR